MVKNMKMENLKENIAITSDHAGYQLKEKMRVYILKS